MGWTRSAFGMGFSYVMNNRLPMGKCLRCGSSGKALLKVINAAKPDFQGRKRERTGVL